MSDTPYLLNLTERLRGGLSGLESDRRDRHVQFILSFQTEDGGFTGREGDSDIYYTSFAVRALALLGALEESRAEAIGGFLKQQQHEKLSVVDLVSWLYSAVAVQAARGGDLLGENFDNFADSVTETLETTRLPDGGYARSTEGASGSTYHSFMVALTYELLGRSLPRPNALVQFIYDRQRDDGGFVEIGPMRRSGTNPSAAAVVLLNLFGNMDSEVKSDIIGFLNDVKSSEGGFQANTRIPFADGLSTFTGLLTATDIGSDPVLDLSKAYRYATECLEVPTGGFRGASWDDTADVEYTFYGLGLLA
ncbi:MAG: prenyltransferase/squalene oxidase repeat-containing protein, partial [Planctomycetaceae bacterium]